jgi:chorismate synthase
MAQPLGLKTPTTVDGSEKKVDPANVPEAEKIKLVADPKGGQMVGGQGKVFGDE